MPLRPCILICAYNEAQWIGRTLELVHALPWRAPVLVIDDGSSDRTAEIAKQKGAHVISFAKNRGKANAFFAGLRVALKQGASSVITLDADMLRLDNHALLQLLRHAENANRTRKKSMAIAATSEEIDTGQEHIPLAEGTYYSGIRSFSQAGIHSILHERHKKWIKGYALEEYLNHAFAREEMMEIPHTTFLQREPIQTPRAKASEARDVLRYAKIRERLSRRKKSVPLLSRPKRRSPRKRP